MLVFNRTTSYIFNKYGEIIQHLKKNDPIITSTIRLKNKSFDKFYNFNEEVYVQVPSGIVMLVVSADKDGKEYEKFVIHRFIKIRPHIKFNFITISSSAKIELSIPKDSHYEMIPTHHHIPISSEPIRSQLHIPEIYSTYYQVRNANYSFAGETHDFWELTYIDNGTLHTNVDGENYVLKKSDLLLYQPGQWHTQSTSADETCSYLTILFDMDLDNSSLIINRVYHATRSIYEAFNNFVKASNEQSLYNGELMLCYLKEIIVKLKQYDFHKNTPIAVTPMQQKFENELLNAITLYINNHINIQLTIEDICHQFSVSRSSLQKLFKSNIGIPPKQYIGDLKLEKSKLMIKENIYTISEISDELGFTSIHYFSRKFKNHYGITPSDYAKTIFH